MNDTSDITRIKQFNPHKSLNVDIRTLARSQQPWPATPRRKIPMIIRHMVQQGMFRS